jgi:hypothetical protein
MAIEGLPMAGSSLDGRRRRLSGSSDDDDDSTSRDDDIDLCFSAGPLLLRLPSVFSDFSACLNTTPPQV